MIYLKYLKYVLVHKFWVAVHAIKAGMWRVAFFHDLSKFSREEFAPYARWFNHPRGIKALMPDQKLKADFDDAWQHHKFHNPHHWDHWVTTDGQGGETIKKMPLVYIKEMLVDWAAMASSRGNPPWKYYEENRHKMKMTDETRRNVEEILRSQYGWEKSSN
ncbi:MAG: DUF5662 family protein [Halobacteriota archaeon]|nr:DUF5662 family protein [Halobacteriota archaeon]